MSKIGIRWKKEFDPYAYIKQGRKLFKGFRKEIRFSDLSGMDARDIQTIDQLLTFSEEAFDYAEYQQRELDSIQKKLDLLMAEVKAMNKDQD